MGASLAAGGVAGILLILPRTGLGAAAVIQLPEVRLTVKAVAEMALLLAPSIVRASGPFHRVGR